MEKGERQDTDCGRNCRLHDASEKKGIYCRNFRKFFRDIAALSTGGQRNVACTRLVELPEAVISLVGFPRESTANKYSYLRSSRRLEKRWHTRCETPLLCFFRSPPPLDVNRRVLSEYTSDYFFIFLSSFCLPLEETERNSVHVEFIFPYV